MGLYDEESNNGEESGEQVPEENNREIGKAIIRGSKKPKPKIDLKMPSGISQVILYILGIVILVAVVWGIYVAMSPEMISAKISPNPTYIGEKTSATLSVEVKNIADHDLTNLILKAVPVDKLSIGVIPSDSIKIPIIGQGEKRSFSFELGTIGNPNPGEYGLDITLETPEGISSEKIYWEIGTYKNK